MAAIAPQIQYRQEWIKGFEQRQAIARMTATTEVMLKGNQATFLVADSGSATAVTRGINGLIPARNDSLTQVTATLTEWHDLVQKTSFNIFESQSDQRAIMQDTSLATINRKLDSEIITELNTGTQDTGTTATASLAMALRAKTILGNAKVPFDGNIYALITPAFESFLLQVKEFASHDYVPIAPMKDANTAWRDSPMMYRWVGVNWIVHPSLPGAATSAEKCFMYHKSAIGHAFNTGDLDAKIGYDEEQDYSWARTTIFSSAKLLQNTGIVVMNHDGSSLAAE
mgnify:CR=1 FL=1